MSKKTRQAKGKHARIKVGNSRFNSIDIICWIIALCLLTQVFLTPLLWGTNRIFPLVPIFESLHFQMSKMGDYLVLALLIISIGFFALYKDRRIGASLLFGLFSLFFIFDLTRVQAWTYQFLLMLWVISFLKKDRTNEGEVLQVLRLMIAFTYFWSGIHKINVYYFTDTFPWLLESFSWTQPLGKYKAVALASVIYESLLGILILFPRFWKYALLLISLFHVLILMVLGPLGHFWNVVVWPWNIAMIAFAWVLFREAIPFDFKRSIRFTPSIAIIVLLGICPLGAWFNIWPDPISLTMYSGMGDEAVVFYDEKDPTCLPPWSEEDKFVSDGLSFLSLDTWAFKELGVPAFPGMASYKKAGKVYCACSNSSYKGLQTMELSDRFKESKKKWTTINCEVLRNE